MVDVRWQQAEVAIERRLTELIVSVEVQDASSDGLNAISYQALEPFGLHLGYKRKLLACITRSPLMHKIGIDE